MDDITVTKQQLEQELTHIHQQKLILNYQGDGHRLNVFATELVLPFGKQTPTPFPLMVVNIGIYKVKMAAVSQPY